MCHSSFCTCICGVAPQNLACWIIWWLLSDSSSMRAMPLAHPSSSDLRELFPHGLNNGMMIPLDSCHSCRWEMSPGFLLDQHDAYSEEPYSYWAGADLLSPEDQCPGWVGLPTFVLLFCPPPGMLFHLTFRSYAVLWGFQMPSPWFILWGTSWFRFTPHPAIISCSSSFSPANWRCSVLSPVISFLVAQLGGHLGLDRYGFESQLFYLPSADPWSNFLTCWSLGFLTYKIGTVLLS